MANLMARFDPEHNRWEIHETQDLHSMGDGNVIAILHPSGSVEHICPPGMLLDPHDTIEMARDRLVFIAETDG